MSRVFLARDEILDRPVAVKVLRSGFGDHEIGARFRREGRTAAKLSHPNVVQVYDAGEDELEGRKTSYIVMEYIPGGDLKALIDQEGPLLPERRLARFGAEAAAGLAHAHERGVIHRDIKPHNILLDERGRAKLTDFGIARALDATTATRTGSYLGTALYSSPEQLRGARVSPKSDVYSLGATLYQAATGEPPFSGAPVEVASQHVSTDPTPPSHLNTAVSEELEALILDCLAKDPEARPDAEEARKRLQTVSDTPGTARAYAPPPASPPPEPRQTTATRPAETVGQTTRENRRRFPRRAAGVLALAALLALLGAAGAVSLLGEVGPQGAGEDTPRQEQGSAPPAQPEAGNPPAPPPQPAAENPPAPPPQPAAGGTPQAQPTGQQAPAVGESPGQESGSAGGVSDEEAAARTIQEHYETAAAGDYESSYALLSQGFKQREETTLASWSSQFETLQEISFAEGPTAQVSGDTATVRGVTIARHTDRTERNTVTWTLVREGGGWKLDDLTFLEQELV